MSKILLPITAFVFFSLLITLIPGSAMALDFGTGPGCSPIEGVLATTIANGDTFTGRIGTTGVSGFNKNGKPADNSDADAFTDSVEECINDALIGFCTTILGNDNACISVAPGGTSGKNGNKQEFTVTFDVAACCMVTQCSDQVDNEGAPDGLIDFPDDPQCTDYDDNDESS